MQQRGGPRFGHQDCYPQPFIQQPQGMNPNWNATTQFVNRAKQTALQQSGNHQLAALFSNNPGGYNNNTMGGGNGNSGNGQMPSDGFMRPPFPSVRMGGGVGVPSQGQQFGGKSGCNCPNCTGAASVNSFQGPLPGPVMGPQQNDGGRGNGVMTFTSQLTGLPIPEHPSGLFPNVDFVMVPATGNGGCDCGCGQHNPMQNFVGGGNNQQQQPMNNKMNMNNQQFGWNGNNSGNNGGGHFCFGGNGMQMNSLI